MKCQNCNMEIPDNLEFCPFCSEKISAPAQPQAPAQPTEAQPEEAIKTEEVAAVKEEAPAPAPAREVQASPNENAQTPVEEPKEEIHAPEVEGGVAERPFREEEGPRDITLSDMLEKVDAAPADKLEAKQQLEAADRYVQEQKARIESEGHGDPSPAPTPMAQAPATVAPAQQPLPQDTGNMPIEQMLAMKVATGEITVDKMMEALNALNGVSQQEEATQSTPEPVEEEVVNEPEEAMPAEPEEQEPEEETEKPKKRGLFKKKEKSKSEQTAEELAKDEFYENTKPEVNDPLPPSPWIRIAKIILMIILVIILVLCAIYFL